MCTAFYIIYTLMELICTYIHAKSISIYTQLTVAVFYKEVFLLSVADLSVDFIIILTVCNERFLRG